MTSTPRPASRRLARIAAQAGAVASAVMLAVTLHAISSPHLRPAYGAGVEAGPAQVINKARDGGSTATVPLSEGNSATTFSLEVPAGAVCPGDSANSVPSYLVQTYMVPIATDPGTLTFDADGPTPLGTGAAFRQPLYTLTGSPVVNQLTAPASPAPGPGPIINIPDMSYGVYAPGDIPPGEYNIGVACTQGPAGDTQMKNFYNVKKTFTTSAAGGPAQVNWIAAQIGTTTTTTSSTATIAGVTTTSTTAGATTTTAGATTTTAAGATSTTANDGATTTTTNGPTTTTSASGGTTNPSTGGFTSGQLSRTGGLSASLVVWSVLLVVFGRMAILVARRPEVRTGARK